MVSDAAPVERGHSEPAFLTKESSAPVQSLRDRRLSEAEVESFNQETVSVVADEEEFVEALQNGTTGHPGTVLPFHPIGQMAGQSTQMGGNGDVRFIAQREEVAIPTQALKPVRPAVVKPRVKSEAKKEGPETMTGTKPPRVGVNIEWVQKGVGWDCREVYYVGKQRRRRHLGHIGRQKWEEMQAQFGGTALEAVLREWIEARRAEKSMGLGGK